MSTGSPASASRSFASATLRSAPPGKSRSQAMASPSQEIVLAPTASEALVASVGVKRRLAGLEIRVATSGIGNSGREGGIGNAILIAGPTASGKSRLALELAEKLD